MTNEFPSRIISVMIRISSQSVTNTLFMHPYPDSTHTAVSCVTKMVTHAASFFRTTGDLRHRDYRPSTAFALAYIAPPGVSRGFTTVEQRESTHAAVLSRFDTEHRPAKGDR
ncbi:unnamed protein product, partial [Pylaiella littoralis]